MAATSINEVIALARRRGFVFPSSPIYGGLQGVYDYGPLGVELKNNLITDWWKTNVYRRDDMEGLDSAVLMHRSVWRYSGHESTFVDPMVDCRACKARWRADQIGDTCPDCGSKDLTEARQFNLMFQTQIGPVADDAARLYLRPETAQGIFVNFANILAATNRRPPFGVAQVGKGFRNEINPRNFLFRVREFDMLEIEYFVPPGTEDTWHQHWLENRLAWWERIGIPRDRLQVYSVPQADLAHYSKATYDLLYQYPTYGWEEIEGIASRSDYDLGAHSAEQDTLGLTARVRPNPESTERLTYFDPTSQRHIVPFVIEPSMGVGRAILALLSEAYHTDMVTAPAADRLDATRAALDAFLRSVQRSERLTSDQRAELTSFGQTILGDLPESLPRVEVLLAMSGADRIELGGKLRGLAQPLIDQSFRTVLRFQPSLAPNRVAIFPLKRNHEGLVNTAKELARELRGEGAYRVVYDDTGAIGKLYRRQDEIGTPFCVTVDFQSLEDRTVTVRQRDSMVQERLRIADLDRYLRAV